MAGSVLHVRCRSRLRSLAACLHGDGPWSVIHQVITRPSLLSQAGLATDKAYARKLEARLSASKSLSDLQLRCCEYKQRVRQLQGDVQEAEAKVQSAQEVADARSDEVLSARMQPWILCNCGCIVSLLRLPHGLSRL